MIGSKSFFKFCTMNEANVSYINGCIEVILMAYPKKFLFWVNGSFRTPNVTSCLEKGCEISRSAVRNFFSISHNERGQERHWIETILLYPEQFDYFGTKMVWCPLHFDSALNYIKIPLVVSWDSYFYQFYSRKGTKSYMKIFLVVSWETISFEQLDLFRPFFNVWLGVVKIEPGYYYYWIFKKLGHD